MNVIKSKNNNIIKDLIKIRDNAKSRNDKSLFYVEGERIFKDTPKAYIDSIFIKESEYNYFLKYLSDKELEKTYIVGNNLFDYIKDTVNSQGIIATVKYNMLQNIDDSVFNKVRNCIVLDSINDPGNLGTIIRIAEAANINLIILANNCCSVFNPKVIRSSMSSIFRVDLYKATDIKKIINEFKIHKFDIYATSLQDNSVTYSTVKFNNRNLIVFGNEANGVSKEILESINNHIVIPMKGKIESLNVSVSVAVICYEIMRQNNFYETES